MQVKDLKPSLIWNIFDRITKIPRPSKKEERMLEFLLDFAEKHQLEIVRGEKNVVLIRKAATKGMENRKSVILQAHMDMVCEKDNEVVHDFDKDPIETYIDGDYVKAKGTTLGGDDGIGVAAALAVLASNDIEHGPIECLFTTDEEQGLSGARSVKAGFMSGDILVNLDTEEEGQFYVGSAGGKGTEASFKYRKESSPDAYYWFKIEVKGLHGGHSGADIHLGFANANKLLVRYLLRLKKESPLALSHIKGGNLHNAIPREAYAVVGIPEKDKEKAIVAANLLSEDVAGEFRHTDPSIRFTVSSETAPAYCFPEKTTARLLLSLNACPNGVMGMSSEIENLVETSTNLASVKTFPDREEILIGTSQRSSTDSLRDETAEMVESVFTLAGAEIESGDSYPGWKPNPDSEILKVAKNVYQATFGKEPLVKAIHAGLECGLFLEKYPSLDMISFGPTIYHVHSPQERILIPTVEKFWILLVELLKNIPEKK